MIAHVSGEVVEKTVNSLIIDVGGLGYEVQVATGDFEAANLNKPIKLYTYDHLRETAHELFGFSNPSSKRFFEMLISVSGVGPKMALAILGLGDADVIRNAIASGDHAFIQRASGVGKRLAERVVVDLKDKVGAVSSAVASEYQTATHGDDALDALLSLGYSQQQASQTLSQIDSTLDVAARIRQALQTIGS
ncbi:MAG TPA: Holliday junction branch migration protein RuvA [Patescibacteria group bacterium]|jgi:Holliday junction DNA helicase RuvA|nr:Holliday junction branch migration protein RuvA [Patescibacteria group bacterium]